MLAITSIKKLEFYDPLAFKAAHPVPARETALDVEVSAIAWAHDDSGLYVAVEGAIRRYDSAGHFERMICCCPGGRITALALKSNGTGLFYAMHDQAFEVDFADAQSTRAFGFGGLSAPVQSLSLSSENSLLALSSKFRCIVHNLYTSTHVIFGGFPGGPETVIATCSFHIHCPTRLFVGYGRYLLVYDTTSPAEPVKSIALRSRSPVSGAAETIVSISSSPYSKTLIVVGFSNGNIGVIDLDKGKRLGTTSMRTPIASLAFAADGTSILIGTTDGKLLIQDLRSIHKRQSPKTIVISKVGNPITGLAVQRQSVTSSQLPISPSLSISKSNRESTEPLSPQNMNLKPSSSSSFFTHRSTLLPERPSARRNFSVKSPPQIKSPFQQRVRRSFKLGTPTPNALPESLDVSPQVSDLTANVSGSSLDVSIQLETLPSPPGLTRRRAPRSTAAVKASPRTKLRMMVTAAAEENAAKENGTRPLRRKASRTEILGSSRAAKSSLKSIATSSTRPKSSTSTARSREVSFTFEKSSSPTKSRFAAKKDDIPLRTSTSSRARSMMGAAHPESDASISVPEISLEDLSEDLSNTSAVDISGGNPRKKRNARGAQALHEEVCSPDDMEGDGWLPLPAVLATAQSISSSDNSETGPTASEENLDTADIVSSSLREVENDDIPPKVTLSSYRAPSSPSRALQLTPARVLSMRHSPVRSSPLNPSATGSVFTLPSSPASAAKLQELMRALLAPTLAEHQQETRAELLGLHLDVLRMGRDVKRDIRESLNEAFEGEVAQLREENRRLREENERLRRGLLG